MKLKNKFANPIILILWKSNHWPRIIIKNKEIKKKSQFFKILFYPTGLVGWSIWDQMALRCMKGCLKTVKNTNMAVGSTMMELFTKGQWKTTKWTAREKWKWAIIIASTIKKEFGKIIFSSMEKLSFWQKNKKIRKMRFRKS